MEIKKIGLFRSPFKEKFGVPKQSMLLDSLPTKIEVKSSDIPFEAFTGLESFSHIWVIFSFSKVSSWSPKVRPPVLGGNSKTGVYSTRSPFRPNHLGLSVLKLESISYIKAKKVTVLMTKGGDIVDQTPIFDIKPYIPKYDSFQAAKTGNIIKDIDRSIDVSFTSCVSSFAQKYSVDLKLIEQTIKLSPIPSYQKETCDKKSYGMSFDKFNITWKYLDFENVLVSNISLSL